MYFLYQMRFMMKPYSTGLYVNILGDDTKYKTYQTRWACKLNILKVEAPSQAQSKQTCLGACPHTAHHKVREF